MINQPETPKQELPDQREKLVLPALPGEYPPVQASSPSHMTKRYGPEDLIRRDAVLPQDPLAKLRYFWHKDSAYKVLIIALAMVLVAGVVFVSLLANAMSRNPNFLTANSSTFSQTPAVPGPTGTVDLRPTFAPPGGGKGSTTSSQPPAHGTPSLQSTATVQDSPTPGSDTLTVQITSIPARVQNYHTVMVGVSTSQPNVTVALYVVYNGAPYKSFAGPTTSDGGGNATLSWTVMVYRVSGARATVVAIAQDQNGQKVQSQPVTVQISTIGG